MPNVTNVGSKLDTVPGNSTSLSVSAGGDESSLIVVAAADSNISVASITWNSIPLVQDHTYGLSVPNTGRAAVWSLHNILNPATANLIVTWNSSVNGKIVFAYKVDGEGTPLLGKDISDHDDVIATGLTMFDGFFTTDSPLTIAVSMTNNNIAGEGNDLWSLGMTSLDQQDISGAAPTVTTGYRPEDKDAGEQLVVGRGGFPSSTIFIIGVAYETTPTPPKELELDFEPPEYTMTGGAGGTPDLDQQDTWEKVSGSGKMEITNTPSEVINESQSLRIDISATPGEVSRYKRLIPSQTGYAINWSWKFMDTPTPNVWAQVEFSFGDDDSAFAVIVRIVAVGGGLGKIVVIDAFGSHDAGQFNVLIATNYGIRAREDLTFTINREEQPIFSGAAKVATIDRIFFRQNNEVT